MTSPQPDPPAGPQGGQGGGQPSDSDRIDRLEQHQTTVDNKLDQILGIIKPGDGGQPPVTQGDQPPAPAPDIEEQMRNAVRAVNAEQQQAGQQQQAPPKETAPREIGVKGKQKLQKALFGGDPK